MFNNHPPLLGFAAFSGTGKTTLLTQLIPYLKNKGLEIGVIKSSHHDIEIDQAGKDSYRLRQAGAASVMLVSPYRRAIISEFNPNTDLSLATQLEVFPAAGLDLILVEGYRDAEIPKIELHRPLLGKPLLFPVDPYIIAIASDQKLITPISLPCLDLNDPQAIGTFILQELFQGSLSLQSS